MGVDLATLLQLLSMERGTCTVYVKSGTNAGYLTIEKGRLKSAKFSKTVGIKAALEILSWNKATFDLKDGLHDNESNIDVSIDKFILEYYRRKDENSNNKNKQSISSINIEESKSSTKKERFMDIKKLNQAIDVLKENLEDSIIATDIFSLQDMQSVAGFNSSPVACAVFGKIIKAMTRALNESGFPALGQYCLLDLADSHRLVLIPMGDYVWGLMMDAKKVPLGALLNIALPKAISAFEEAMA